VRRARFFEGGCPLERLFLRVSDVDRLKTDPSPYPLRRGLRRGAGELRASGFFHNAF